MIYINNNVLITGGSTTTSRFIVELIYLGVSAAIGAWTTYITKNPGMLPGEYMIIARLVLGLVANLLNSKISNV